MRFVQVTSHQQVFLTGPLSKAELPLGEVCLKLTEQAVVGGAVSKDPGDWE